MKVNGFWNALKKTIVLCLLMSPIGASASGFKSQIVAQNFVLWRGLDFSHTPGGNRIGHDDTAGGFTVGGAPGIGGGISYFHDSGFSLGTYTMNLRPPFIQEAHHWLAYTHKFDEDLSLTGTVYRRWFPPNVEYSRLDYQMQLNWKALTFHVSYMPEYFYGPGFDGKHDKQSSDLYLMLNYHHPIDENVFVVGEVGRSTFSDERYVGMKSYTHYYLGLRHTKDNMSVDLGWSGTDRKEFLNGPNLGTAAGDDSTFNAKDSMPWLKFAVNL